MYSHEYYEHRQLFMDTTYHNDPWSSLYALLICLMFYRSMMLCLLLWTATSVHLEAVVAHQMLEDSFAPSMLIFFIMSRTWQNVAGKYPDALSMDNSGHSELTQHHYHHHDDDATAKVHYWTFNVWRNHGSNDRILWQCYGDIYGKYCDTEVYCDNIIEFHDTSSSLSLPSLSGSGNYCWLFLVHKNYISIPLHHLQSFLHCWKYDEPKMHSHIMI